MSQKGFTIIEMLVIVGIMLLMSGVLIIYSRSGETASVVIRQAAKMVSDINRTKNLAITTASFKTSEGSMVHPCGYGVYFDSVNEPNRYIIFADLSSDCDVSDHIRPIDGLSDLETIPLTTPLAISNKNINQVFFLSPDPTVFLGSEEGGEIKTGEITIKAPNSETEVKVKVSKTGQVSTF